MRSQLYTHFPQITLASASPRRADLLQQIGVEFQICPSHIAEPEFKGKPPRTIVQTLALMKAEAVGSGLNSGLIIGADTLVVIEPHVLGKPHSNRHAREMLMQLSGNQHTVITGVALVDLDRTKKVVWAEETDVYFRELRESEIQEYIDSGEALDKAGAYGIQGQAAAFVERIEGCYFNVVGLPLASLVERLWKMIE